MKRICVAVVAVVLGLLFRGEAFASQGPVVVFTIDVESEGTLGLPEQINAICKDGAACGLNEIVRLLRERGWAGTFFLNVYEHRKWGEPALRKIAVDLQAAGQDLALHTHPHWIYDAARPGMNEYTLDEQTSIVRDGVRLLQGWTGKPVVAHRAGAYAADERTLVALDRNGVLMDSSLFWAYPGNKLQGLGLPRNFPGRYGRVTQIPVSVYERQDRPRYVQNLVAPVGVIRKIDPDWLVNADEARTAIDELIAMDVPVVVVFLHSFSLMTKEADGRAPAADRHSFDMFRAILDHVTERRLRVTTLRDLPASTVDVQRSPANDGIPAVSVAIDWPTYAWRRAKTTNRWSLAAAAGLPVLCAVAFVVVRRRGAARRGDASGALATFQGLRGDRLS
jgi:peptidoglycan/xylan/chitin deacetylase (PgdA/CDA1 family)